MPIYEYECSSCGSGFEIFETMQEHADNPVPHCPDCDPKGERPTTLYRYMGNVAPRFKVNGEGAYDTRMQ